MLYIPILISAIGIILIVISIILNFVGADLTAQRWLSIIGLLFVIVGVIVGILMFHSGGGSVALGTLAKNPTKVAEVIENNPKLFINKNV